MRKVQIVSIWTFFLVIPFFSYTQSTITNRLTIFQKLKQDSILHLKLEADFDYIFNQKKNNDEHEAHLKLINSDDSIISMTVKVRLRGIYRRQFCDRPPLRINFNKKILDSLGLKRDFDKLKLVTHCVETPNAEQVLLKEFWAYKLHNELTPNSFQVHLIKITYINSKNKHNQAEHFGFLIENNEEMANRLGGELVEKFGITPTRLNPETHQNTMLFNYMIGNLDWMVRKQRNTKFVQIPNQKGLTLVPYDFDMSALVTPSYARLNPDYNQKRFTDRFCVGRFTSETALNKTIKRFQTLETTYINNIKSAPNLNDISKKEIVGYLKSFFKPLNKKKYRQRKFLALR